MKSPRERKILHPATLASFFNGIMDIPQHPFSPEEIFFWSVRRRKIFHRREKETSFKPYDLRGVFRRFFLPRTTPGTSTFDVKKPFPKPLVSESLTPFSIIGRWSHEGENMTSTPSRGRYKT